MPGAAFSAPLLRAGIRSIMSGAADPASTQPVGKGGPPTPQAQSANDPSSMNATPPPPERAASSTSVPFSDGSGSGTPVQGAADGSGTPSGGGPQACPATPAVREDTDDEHEEDPEATWVGNDKDDDEGGWDEQNKKMDDRVIYEAKLIPMNLLDRDREMNWGQIRSLGPLIWKKHQEGFAMTPPKAPVSVLVKALHGM